MFSGLVFLRKDWYASQEFDAKKQDSEPLAKDELIVTNERDKIIKKKFFMTASSPLFLKLMARLGN